MSKFHTIFKYFAYIIFSLLIICTFAGLFVHQKEVTSALNNVGNATKNALEPLKAIPADLAQGITNVQEFVQNQSYKPCSKPIPYQINSIDPKFNISKTELISDLNKASSVWSVVIGHPLFTFYAVETSTTNANKITSQTPEADIVKINFVYDYRQKATDSIHLLGITISSDQKTYTDLKSQYNSLTTDYQNQKTTLLATISQYQAALQNYNQSVSYWNSRGGAPRNEYNTLSTQKASLQTELVQINSLQNNLNSKVDTINTVVAALNQVAQKINATVVTYNKVGSSTGQEFNEGEYIQTSTSTRINIYQYTDTNGLIRVLEHEFGHALGLGHVTDPKSIMYAVNQGSNLSLSAADIAELKNICNSI